MGYTLGRLLDGTKCQLLLDTGASKSFMSKSFYIFTVSHYIPYQNLQLARREYKWKMDNALVYYS